MRCDAMQNRAKQNRAGCGSRASRWRRGESRGAIQCSEVQCNAMQCCSVLVTRTFSAVATTNRQTSCQPQHRSNGTTLLSQQQAMSRPRCLVASAAGPRPGRKEGISRTSHAHTWRSHCVPVAVAVKRWKDFPTPRPSNPAASRSCAGI